MQRRSILILLSLCSQAFGVCPTGTPEEWEKKLTKADIPEVFLKDNTDSFALKVIVPNLLKGRIALTRDYLHCWTLKEEDKKEWAACLRPMLGKNENVLLESCLIRPAPSEVQRPEK